MNKVILAYGLIIGAILSMLKWFGYRFVVADTSLEIYITVIAITCAGIGIWMGLKLTKPKTIVTYDHEPFQRDENRIKELGISLREIEVLELLAEGLSNQEIADRLFISTNTIKTHTSALYSKLGASRRTQAVQLGKQWHIIA